MAPSPQSVDVVVVGAGLSGLRAARELHSAGLKYVVLEARDRIGGKTLSVQASPGGKGLVDMGAAWINDTSQSEMYNLAREFGFDLVEQRTGGTSLYRDGEGEVHCIPYGVPAKLEPEQLRQVEQLLQVISEHVDKCDLEHPAGGLDAQRLDSITVKEYADGFNDPGASQLVNAITRSLLGVESDELSALFFLDTLKRGTGLTNVLSDHKDGGQYLRNRQGNQAFCERLAAGLHADSVKVNCAVEAISPRDAGCVVEASNGASYKAHRVIVSVPTPFYSSIRFDPDLPPGKKTLSQSTESGYYTKTVLVFDEPWWHSTNLSGEYSSANGPIGFTRDTCVPADGQYSITCFHTGASGRQWSTLSAEERRRVVLEDFRAAFRKVVDPVPEPIHVVEKDWTQDEWARGGPGPIMKTGLLAGEAGKSISESFGNIHFVGTETSPMWRGYMEGAVRSGIRGGKEVAAALTK
ncbi:Monoamine oxidase [Purpureocillium takamizusanense]|uniref:Amine oxidase n=1 Tax=Purpureocillium takamizusanense TaxID=2060973 RepID=A0A9Q8QGM4_9HYPO|nr:Monoamine oxidase [Purpureocillium takamizusanense]UNI18539.1 Monoamine oxidase [Purpureocillium takamizusanense]